MERRGDITSEDARRAAYAFSQGDLNNPIIKKAMAEEIDRRAGPTLFGYVTGLPVRTFSVDDERLNQAYEAQAAIWDSRDSLSPEAWSAAWDEFYRKYPFMETLSIARSDRLEGDTQWVYEVLRRLPPGQASSIVEGTGVPKRVLDEFYANRGFVDKDGQPTMDEKDRMLLLSAILRPVGTVQGPNAHNGGGVARRQGALLPHVRDGGAQVPWRRRLAG
jgi:hypothetical protein